ncbi:helix-turn-helix domain-containing protein [Legionella rowbothamii]|uniref:helix-turn-helix domain-containing protein n=1 Tax=Legionella rowbothamii TaxID=96229 RepID=UPI0010566607|nr:helix-turn-helix domain-containing protein [Legionella rowbothamii]
MLPQTPGGRPQGLTKQATEKACAAEALYRQGELTSEKIALQLGISKPTLYKYLKFRCVPIGFKDAK